MTWTVEASNPDLILIRLSLGLHQGLETLHDVKPGATLSASAWQTETAKSYKFGLT